MSQRARAAGINIDWYPTNLVVETTSLLFNIDFECNVFMEEWSYENWGLQHRVGQGDITVERPSTRCT